MDEFLRYLSNLHIIESGIFSPCEMDEIILLIYKSINGAVREQCDTIEVTANCITRSRMGRKIRDFETPVDFRPAFQKIISRDRTVQAHLRVVEDTEEKTTYKLTKV